MRHFLNISDLTTAELTGLLERTAQLKAAHARQERSLELAGRVLGLVFEKPSLRTRVSFETAMAQLGGVGLFLSGNDAGLGVRETVPDFARTISQYVDAVVLRTFRHDTVAGFAQYSACPVINGLSDAAHPCQALADLFTVTELVGPLSGKTIAFLGDGNNVARSLAVGCGMLGGRFVLSSPKGYGFDKAFCQLFRQLVPNGTLVQQGTPARAVAGADIIYTDVWASMGQEAERDERLARFAPYQVNADLLRHAPANVRVMHCLPAHRGEEITDDVLDGPHSVAFHQAANRLHAQKALLIWLLSDMQRH